MSLLLVGGVRFQPVRETLEIQSNDLWAKVSKTSRKRAQLKHENIFNCFNLFNFGINTSCSHVGKSYFHESFFFFLTHLSDFRKCTKYWRCYYLVFIIYLRRLFFFFLLNILNHKWLPLIHITAVKFVGRFKVS